MDISLDADIETHIKVASFEVRYSQDNGITWKKAEFWHGFFFPSNGKNYVKILNTGNVPLRYKNQQDSNGIGSYWFLYNNEYEWKNLNAGEYSENFGYSDSRGDDYASCGVFVIDTIGVAFDNEGMDDLVFTPNTSRITQGEHGIGWENFLD